MKFITTPTALTVVLDRSEQIAALKAKIVIRVAEVNNLLWFDTFEEWRRWEVRMPGSSIPNRLLAGSYWTEEGWDFLYIRRPVGVRNTVALDVIVIELKGHEKYTRVILSAEQNDFNNLDKWLKVAKKSTKANMTKAGPAKTTKKSQPKKKNSRRNIFKRKKK